MQPEKIRKIRKRTLIATVVFLVLGILVSLGFMGILFIGVIARIGNNMYAQEQRSIPYMIGKGCDDYENVSEEELNKEVKSEINCCISKNKFKKLLSKQREYSLNDLPEYKSIKYLSEEAIKQKESDERCIILLDRIEKILNDLK